jgi:hypothetical protein
MTDVSTTPFRQAGKRGLKKESHEPRLLASKFLEAAEPLTEWDGSSGITDWGMDGNDQYENCGEAGANHGFMAKTAKGGDVAAAQGMGNVLGEPKFASGLATYFAYGIAMGEPGPEPDEGVDNKTWLGFLYEQGIIDYYLEVPLDSLESYAQQQDGLLVGVLLDDDAEANFEATPPVPWGSSGETPDPNDGHDTYLIKTHADGSVTLITWGADQVATAEFLADNVTDAWAFGIKAQFIALGGDWEKLQAALDEVHGVIRPTPTIEPSPTTVPVQPPHTLPVPPTPLPAAHEDWWQEVIEWAIAHEAVIDDLIEKLEALEPAPANAAPDRPEDQGALSYSEMQRRSGVLGPQ